MRANCGIFKCVLSKPYNVKPGGHDTRVTCPYVPGCQGGNLGCGGRGRGGAVEIFVFQVVTVRGAL